MLGVSYTSNIATSKELIGKINNDGDGVSYGIFENSSLAVEYLCGEFENDDKEQTVTAQFAIEF